MSWNILDHNHAIKTFITTIKDYLENLCDGAGLKLKKQKHA